MTTPDLVVTVTSVHTTRLHHRVVTCGRTFAYLTHLERPDGIALLLECLCPAGHGPAGLPWKGWVDPTQGRYDIARATPVVPLPLPTATPAAPVAA